MGQLLTTGREKYQIYLQRTESTYKANPAIGLDSLLGKLVWEENTKVYFLSYSTTKCNTLCVVQNNMLQRDMGGEGNEGGCRWRRGGEEMG